MELSLTTLIRFRDNLRVLEREIARTLKNETACCGVTFSQCHIILELDLRGDVSIKQLAALMDLDSSTLSRVIDNMVTGGLIDRTVNPDDRRAVILTLTDKGRDIAATINGQCNAFYQGVFHQLPSEKHALIIESIALLGAALKSVRQEGVPASQAGCPNQ